MSNPKILVVDDDPDLVRALRLRLRANNYDVTTASDGYAAIASAQRERPALIILDLGLPVLAVIPEFGDLGAIPFFSRKPVDARLG